MFDVELRKVRRAVAPHMEVSPEALDFEPIPTGKFNTSYFVSADGKQYVLRIAPDPNSEFLFYERDMMRQEPDLHDLIRRLTSVPVAEIVAFDGSRGVIPRDFLLMRRLPGIPMTEARHLSRAQHARVLRQIGVHLAALHRIRAEKYGYLGAHRPMEPQSRWWPAFRIMWRKLLDDIVRVGWYDNQEREWMASLLDQSREHFDRDVPSCLLHMDIWHQNILVDAHGRVTGIVDWDRALWGDVEIEFAVLDYCGISEPSFWEGYGQPRDSSPSAQIRRVFYLLYELQKYIVIRQGRGHDPTSAESYKRQALSIIQQYFR